MNVKEKKSWTDYLITIFALPVFIGVFVAIIWLALKFDLAGDAYNEEGNPNIEVQQQYGGR